MAASFDEARNAILSFADQFGGYGATSYAELRRWALQYHKDRPSFDEVRKALGQLRGQVKGSGREPFRWFSGVQASGPQIERRARGGAINRGLIRATEEDAWRRAGVETGGALPPRLPVGRALSWTQQRETQAGLRQGYGLNDIIGRYGAPVGVNDPGVFHFAVDPAQMQGRAYARLSFPREDILAATGDERLSMIAGAQASFQYRPEEVRRGADLADMVSVGGGRDTLETLERVNQQVDSFPLGRSRVVFDLETASLVPEHGIRQLSYRITNPAGELTENVTLDFANDVMGAGHFGMPVDKFLQAQAEGRPLLSQDDLAGNLLTFFEKANKTDVLVGQNAAFDVNMLMFHTKGSSLYRQGAELAASGADPATLSGRDAMAVRMKDAADAFFEKTRSATMVDTAAHARVTMAAFGGKRLEVAPEILRKGQATGFSIENILLQSSFLEDAMARGLTTPEQMREVLTGSGLHSADVDTWFTDMLYQLQGLSYQGEDVLRPEALSAKTFHMIHGRAGTEAEVSALRRGISEHSAITPFHTILDVGADASRAGQLQHLVGSGVMSLEEARGARLTAVDQMMLLSRNMSLTPGQVETRRLATGVGKGGIWDRFRAKFGMTTESGGIRGRGLFPQVEDASRLHQELAKAGAPFAGLSPLERQMSEMMGQVGAEGDAAAHLRSLVSGHVPVGVLQSSGLRVFPMEGKGRTVAMPLQMLREMEEQGVTRGTSLEKAEERTGVQWLSLSPFQSRTRKGNEISDVAFNVRGVIGQDTTDEDVGRIMAYLRKLKPEDQTRLGVQIDKRLLGRVEEGLRATGSTVGIQVGTLGGAKPNQATSRLFSFLSDLGFTADRADRRLAAPLLTDVEGGTAVGPIFNMAGGVAEREEGAVLGGVQHLIGKEKGKVGGVLGDLGQLAGDERFMAQMRGGLAAEGKLAEAPAAIVNFLRKHTNKQTALIGAGLLAAGWYYRREKKARPWDEVMETQEPESPDFYATYKREMGEPYSPPRAALSSPRSGDPLATARVVGNMNDNRTGHHRMGSNKNNRLFGAATRAAGFGWGAN